MKLFDPITGIGNEELADRAGVRPVEIDRLAPLVFVALGEIAVGKPLQVIPVRAEVVVDDVENDGQAKPMGTVDEAAEIIRAAIEPGRREKVDAVIAPAETARKLRHRHDFNAGDPKLGERG